MRIWRKSCLNINVSFSVTFEAINSNINSFAAVFDAKVVGETEVGVTVVDAAVVSETVVFFYDGKNSAGYMMLVFL